MELASLRWWISTGANALRTIRAKGVVWRCRDIAVRGLLSSMHLDVMHTIRPLMMLMDSGEISVATQLALKLCTEFRETMGMYIEVPPNQLHCCLKMVAPKKDPADEDMIGTWVR